MMSVKYSRSRGAEVAGEDVQDSKAWLIEVLQHNHEATAAYFNSIPEESQSEILDIFGGENVFESAQFAQGWIQSEDEEALDEIVNQLKEKLGSA